MSAAGAGPPPVGPSAPAVPVSAGSARRTEAPTGPAGPERDWPLWEVFVRARRGMSHVHAGSLHAPDAALALRNARDLYTRRQEGVSIWVVPAAAVTASQPEQQAEFFDPAAGKDFRYPTYYEVPEGVEQL